MKRFSTFLDEGSEMPFPIFKKKTINAFDPAHWNRVEVETEPGTHVFSSSRPTRDTKRHEVSFDHKLPGKWRLEPDASPSPDISVMKHDATGTTLSYRTYAADHNILHHAVVRFKNNIVNESSEMPEPIFRKHMDRLYDAGGWSKTDLAHIGDGTTHTGYSITSDHSEHPNIVDGLKKAGFERKPSRYNFGDIEGTWEKPRADGKINRIHHVRTPDGNGSWNHIAMSTVGELKPAINESSEMPLLILKKRTHALFDGWNKEESPNPRHDVHMYTRTDNSNVFDSQKLTELGWRKRGYDSAFFHPKMYGSSIHHQDDIVTINFGEKK